MNKNGAFPILGFIVILGLLVGAYTYARGYWGHDMEKESFGDYYDKINQITMENPDCDEWYYIDNGDKGVNLHACDYPTTTVMYCNNVISPGNEGEAKTMTRIVPASGVEIAEYFCNNDVKTSWFGSIERVIKDWAFMVLIVGFLIIFGSALFPMLKGFSLYFMIALLIALTYLLSQYVKRIFLG